MSMFDSLMGGAGSIDLEALAKQVGLNPDELKSGGEAMLGKLASGQHDADSAATAVSAETGLDPSKLLALLPALAAAMGESGEGGLGGLIGRFTGGAGAAGGEGGALGQLEGFAKGLFGRG